ncbi:MAG: hypothetical protein K8I27_10975 [Planctomycetes bacterium]|nr:hypothetical protein [Planctomycetota bacterium]
MRRITPLLLLILFVSACGASLPPEAVSTAENAAKALAAEDNAGFANTVLPAQREGALGLPVEYPIEAGKKASELTLLEVLRVEFFRDIKAAEVSLDNASMDDETNATVYIGMDWEDGSFTSKTFQLKKEGDKWYIDFKETLKTWHTLDGASALSVMELK